MENSNIMLSTDLLFIISFIEISLRSCATTRATKLVNKTIERSRRGFGTKYLVFPEGSNVQLVYCLTISTYSKPTGMFTMGVTSGLAWELPNANDLSRTDPAEAYHRRSRRELYRKVELMLETHGKDGEACVLKAICKAAKRSRLNIGKGTFLEEIQHSLFSLPETLPVTDIMTKYDRAYFSRENCNEVDDRCPDVF